MRLDWSGHSRDQVESRTLRIEWSVWNALSISIYLSDHLWEQQQQQQRRRVIYNNKSLVHHNRAGDCDFILIYRTNNILSHSIAMHVPHHPPTIVPLGPSSSHTNYETVLFNKLSQSPPPPLPPHQSSSYYNCACPLNWELLFS